MSLEFDLRFVYPKTQALNYSQLKSKSECVAGAYLDYVELQ